MQYNKKYQNELLDTSIVDVPKNRDWMKKVYIYINDLRNHLNGLVISLITEASSIFYMPNFYTEYIPMHELEFLVTEYKDEAIKRIMLNPKLYLWTED